jgi:hypothetical protein
MEPGSKADDETWADFLDVELIIEGFDINGDCMALEECYICPSCDKPCESHEVEVAKEKSGIECEFMCPNCCEEYSYGSHDFINANGHLPKEKLIAFRV